jgi:uncharacterized membrane protein YphA (DoxX/SURF4 family)
MDSRPPARERTQSRRDRARPQRARRLWIAGIRWVAAIVFVAFGAGKFVNHASELSSFRNYGLPLPDAFVYAIGVLELAGGVLLASGVLVRLAAFGLAADMLGAIIVSGIGRGENVSLTLAPALLVAMLIVLRFYTPAPGRRASLRSREPTRAGARASRSERDRDLSEG